MWQLYKIQIPVPINSSIGNSHVCVCACSSHLCPLHALPPQPQLLSVAFFALQRQNWAVVAAETMWLTASKVCTHSDPLRQVCWPLVLPVPSISDRPRVCIRSGQWFSSCQLSLSSGAWPGCCRSARRMTGPRVDPEDSVPPRVGGAALLASRRWATVVTLQSHTSLLLLVSSVFMLSLVVMAASLAAFCLGGFFTSQLRNSHATLFTFIKL